MLLYLFVADQYRQIQVKIVTFNTSTTNHCILQNHQMRQQIVSDVAYHTSRVHGKVLQSSRDVNLFISSLSQAHVTQQCKTYNLQCTKIGDSDLKGNFNISRKNAAALDRFGMSGSDHDEKYSWSISLVCF
jgi:hypothetical protein